MTTDASTPAERGASLDGGRALLVAAAGVVLLFGVHFAAGVLAPVFMAFVIAVTAYPLQRLLKSKGWPTAAGLLATLAATYAVLLGFVLMVLIALRQFVEVLPTYTARIQDVLSQVSSKLGDPLSQDTISSADAAKLAQWLTGAVNGVLGVVGMSVTIVAVIFFLAIDALHFPAAYAAMAQERPHVAAGWSRWADQTRRYIAVSTLFGLIVGLVDALLLLALGVPLAVAMGLLAFVTNYVPNIGFVIGLIPAAVLGLLEGGPSTMLWVVIGYCVVNFGIQELIQPKVVGDTVNLAATLTFVSVLFWTFVIGPLGAILCVPLTLFVQQVVLRPYVRSSWIADLMGATAEPLRPDVQPLGETQPVH